MRYRLHDWRAVLVPAAAMIRSSYESGGGKDWVELKSGSAGSGSTLHISGTVHRLDVGGGLFVIRDTEGRQYHPLNLPQAFRFDAAAVEADARRRDDVVSIEKMVGAVVELLRIRRRGDGATGVTRLTGTKWRLEDLAGAGVMDGVQATLEFPAEGEVTGNASCNRFHGTVTISDAAIAVRPLATTRKLCGEALMHQENQYLAALREARRFEIEGGFLHVFTADRAQPLRFAAVQEPGNQGR